MYIPRQSRRTMLPSPPHAILSHNFSKGTGMYELLLKGAKVIDPSQGINQNMDVSISGGKIGRVAPEIDS